GWITSVHVGPHFHIFEPWVGGWFLRSTVWKAESRADDLALELLAPAETLCATLRASGRAGSYARCLAYASSLLSGQFGLPEPAARLYARRLTDAVTGGDSLLSRLGLEGTTACRSSRNPPE